MVKDMYSLRRGFYLKIRHLIFDLDGTLIHLPVNWTHVKHEVSSFLARNVDSLIQLYSEIWRNKELFKKVSDIVEKHELEATRYVKILDDAPEVLRSLKEKYSISLVTLQSKNVAERILAYMDVRELFKVIITRENVPIRSEQIRLVLKLTNFKPEETLVIGDLLNDINSALIVGCKAVLIKREWVHSSIKENPNIKVIKSLKELPYVLRDFSNS